MNLFSRKICRLYFVSEKPDKNGKYQLVQIDDKAFNQDIDEDKIEDTLTDLAKDFFYREDGCCWFNVYFNDKQDDEKTFRARFSFSESLEIRNISHKIDLPPGGVFLFYVVINLPRRTYQWVAVSMHTIYSDCETIREPKPDLKCEAKRKGTRKLKTVDVCTDVPY